MARIRKRGGNQKQIAKEQVYATMGRKNKTDKQKHNGKGKLQKDKLCLLIYLGMEERRSKEKYNLEPQVRRLR